MINEIKSARSDVSLPIGYKVVTAAVSAPALRPKLVPVSVKLTLGLFIGALYATSSFASLTAVGPFAGTYSETFDGFPPSVPEQLFVPDSVSTFDGHATMTGSQSPTLAVYTSFGNYVPIDGLQFVVSQDNSRTTSFAFDRHLNDFGGYFGTSIYNTELSTITDLTVTFRDAAGNVVGTDTRLPASNTALTWIGWHSDTSFTTVEITASAGFYLMDSLQVQAVPEPSTVIAGALLLIPLAFSKVQAIRKK